MEETYDLSRFLEAQSGGVFDRALSEIKRGQKTTHWMWFIFPQIIGLGQSEIARYYSIKNTAEARAYLEDPTLGTRLRECCKILNSHQGNDAFSIFGSPDDLKLFSSMTLFDYISSDDIFSQILSKFYAGKRDPKTIKIIERQEEEI